MEKILNGTERRKKIMELLAGATSPVSGGSLGRTFGVSRQVVVQDIALLRSEGNRILSTVQGYYIEDSKDKVMLVKVHHGHDQIEEELNTIVDLGGTVLDVMVNHRTYGKLQADLKISTRKDVQAFLENLRQGRSAPLLSVTMGYHFHHIGAPNQELLEEIHQALQEKGYLAEMYSYEEE